MMEIKSTLEFKSQPHHYQESSFIWFLSPGIFEETVSKLVERYSNVYDGVIDNLCLRASLKILMKDSVSEKKY